MPDRVDSDHQHQNTQKSWWKIALFAILGGLIGLGASFLQTPLYQAEAIFSATIDFTQVNAQTLADEDGGVIQFTQYDEDMALLVVQNTLLAQMDEVYAYAKTLDPTLDREEFEANKQIRRYHGLWYLRVLHQDPEIAQAIANTWAEKGDQALTYAQAKGFAAPFVRADLVSKAALPEEPLFRHRNTLMVAGMLLGLIVGVLWVDRSARAQNDDVEVGSVKTNKK